MCGRIAVSNDNYIYVTINKKLLKVWQRLQCFEAATFDGRSPSRLQNFNPTGNVEQMWLLLSSALLMIYDLDSFSAVLPRNPLKTPLISQ